MMFVSSVAQAAAPAIYVVKSGDTLSTIAHEKIGPPVYTKDGSLAKILIWNPTLNPKKFIHPGQEIVVSESGKDSDIAVVALENEPESLTAKDESAESSKATTRERDPGNNLLLGAELAQTTLASTDPAGATAQLYSSRDVRVRAAWEQVWTDSFATYLGVGLRSIDFQQTSNNSKTLADTAKLLTSIFLGGEKVVTAKLLLSAGVDLDNQLFMRGVSTTSINIDARPLPTVFVGADYKVFERPNTTLGLNGKFGYIASSSGDGYAVNAGTSAQAGVYYRRHFGKSSYAQLDLGLRYRNQPTSILETREMNVLAGLSFSLPLFEGAGRK